MKYIEDIGFLIGLLVIVITTFFLNIWVGCYLVGALFIVFSLLIGQAKPSTEERSD